MNSKKRSQEAAHRVATRLAYESACVVCGRTPCVPAHWPRHQGSGGRWPDPWARHRWEPLCRFHHDLVDGRAGVSRAIEAQRRLAIDTLIRVTAREEM